MVRRLTVLVTVLLAFGVLTGGCGDDGESSGSDDAAAAAGPRTPKEAVEQCKAGVNGTLTLKLDIKRDLLKICQKAQSGEPDDVREALVEVCKTLIGKTIPPNTKGRDRALASCERRAKL